MLPMTARIMAKDSDGKGVNLWLPLFLLWALALVLFVLCLPFLAIYGVWRLCRRKRILTALPFIAAVMGLLSALRGLKVEGQDGGSKVKIIIW